ncbi:hypothetical protein BU16DRAFT_11561 [Lophium mytilinum]|uniref:Calcineurin-like phosphoesterase domain-containing protein n=1 Tax=Lophium mytilinum TaxID=390894 RepID=A0A6A6RDP3_9PEZI|nr:hypothetical protein BU16DRAFT_11561 [Lophium mytilinum]
MRFSLFLLRLVRLVLPLCIIATVWLYLYPIFHGCAFPIPPTSCASNTFDPSSSSPAAPFRLLALGDPQLEGDSSLPDANSPTFPSIRQLRTILEAQTPLSEKWKEGSACVVKFWKHDILRFLKATRKRLDLWGNDYYLAHIYRSLQDRTEPTHVSVLGDLLGSQWIGDTEFERRGRRFWNRVFEDAERVPDRFMEDSQYGPWIEELGHDEAWNKRIINIAGNHDVGYAGDLTKHRVERFEKLFGKVNWEVTFTLRNHTQPTASKPTADPEKTEGTENAGLEGPISEPPAIRIIVLNSMNLDTSAISPDLQKSTYDFLNSAISNSRPVEDHTTATILLTHIPLHKEAGICKDAPFFDFYTSGGIREQNHLSPFASKGILEGIFGLSANKHAPGMGLGRKGIVINGHDHEGCDVVHYLKRSSAITPESESAEEPESNSEEPQWNAMRTPKTAGRDLSENGTPNIREITLRSMMGEFGGYAGFLSAWFDESLGERGEWTLEYASCTLGVQHWWWAVHVLDLIVLVTAALGVIIWTWEQILAPEVKAPPKDKKVDTDQAQRN